MKADPEVKMISAEAPILFAKGCDIFITELTMRAWIHAEENKRRTLQRSDIASALSKSDMFDFLIDIVPREEASTHAKRATAQATAQAAPSQAQMAAPNHGQHPMAGEYGSLGGHAIAPDADYRQAQNMYPGQPGAPAPYGQPQAPMYNVDDMYGYGAMPPQQVSDVFTKATSAVTEAPLSTELAS
jgi:nuclear transcription factor Y, gamma